MATIALMIGGAILNATAFVGGSYLARYLSSDGTHVDKEKIRHDKALEKYQQAMGEWQKKRQEYQDWLAEEYNNKVRADENDKETDEAFRLYSQTHPDFDLKEPELSEYYRPSSDQKMGEMAYVGGGMLALGYVASKWI